MRLDRRQFVQTVAGTSAALTGLASLPAWSGQPIARTGAPRLRLGLAAYSLRRSFAFMKGKPQRVAKADMPAGSNVPLTMVGFIDQCASWNVDGAELTGYFLAPEEGSDAMPSDDSLRSLAQYAFLKGMSICGTAIGNDFTVASQDKLQSEITAAEAWIDKAHVLRAPHIRFFAGTASQLAAGPERMDQAINALERCGRKAETLGIFLGVENHGGLNADQMLEIMHRIESPAIGINLDTGNFLSEDPYKDLQRCLPYTVNVQVKTTMKTPGGVSYAADLNRVIGLLRDGGYQGYAVLEYEEENPYEKIPKALDQLRDAMG